MSWLSPVELIGYLASALVVASLAMTSVVRLRTISLVGSVTFVVYGVLIGSIPIVITNAAIAVLNVYFLRRELGGGRALGASPIAADAPVLGDFLSSHLEDIHQSQPDFQRAEAGDWCLVLTRDGLPAGALVGRREGSTLEVTLDYVMHAYRDSRLGEWLYGPGAKVFREAGIGTVRAHPTTAVHTAYLRGVGFADDRAATWVGGALVRTVG